MSNRFQDLRVFQRAVDFMVDIDQSTERFPKYELYGLVMQMRKAAVSVVSHIAEGEGRITPGEWRQLLSQARGSLFEVPAQLISSNRLGCVASELHTTLDERAAEIARELNSLICHVAQRERQGSRARVATAELPSTEH
jgi:four helix bundle protein